ncbi:hypothetical protein P168DRAFT_291484 [Aspergillus campestris IBT 28561]|uniref:Uncharacterized protein n=1 Tax=Aspergillus campestris (strain IBT 28561) TaxID=1392248 RepID=A0A2I1D0G3_ASPC2|nr:uncharacterized protein P168DRAFT_291484 [Aspergillus campestris IBT 28561]PKY03361.1 hypothetical protein P168DRAFT_291484 [Aspergillus campestris IBT 28561]
MPPRPPIPPPSLETCSVSNPDLDTDGIIGSDDELDDVARVAQRSRIEKLAESYAQGAPVYILSASLRGPFDDGWVNPWKKNRRRDYTKGRSGRTKKKRATSPSPVVQETNSRKRRPYHDSEIREARTSAASPSSSVGLSIGKFDPRADSQRRSTKKSFGNKRGLSAVSPNTPRRIPPSIVGSDVPSQHSAPSRPTDHRWLKKDHVRIGFSQVDPPTSPTTSISSRVAETRSRVVEGSSKKRKSHPSNDRSPSKSNELKRPFQRGNSTPSRNVHDRSRVDARSSSPGKHLCPPTVVKRLAEASYRDPSFHVLSSSSQLPKFEYRRRRQLVPDGEAHFKPPPTAVANERGPAGSVASNDTKIADNDLEVPRESPSTNIVENGPPESAQGPRASFTTSNTSNTLRDASDSHSEDQTSGFHTKGNTSEKLPSAQQVQENPTIMDYTTSLRSIAIQKTNSEHDGDANHTSDPPFSTQAALRLAQKSFQNDLDTPNRIPAISDQTGLTSRSLDPGSAGSKNITPFHQMTAPAIDDGHKSAPGTTAHQMISTQHIIDAVTPFTFSAEKKIQFLTASSHKERSRDYQSDSRLPSSPISPTPSENHREPPTSGGERDSVHNESCQQPSIPIEMQSALAMTLSGTTPPTAQDGQGAADSFNLSQAIAEAGSWLQHSFDLNRDIMAMRHSKPGSSAKTARSAAVSFDTTK